MTSNVEEFQQENIERKEPDQIIPNNIKVTLIQV
jgi:hypothetical protein